MNLEYLAGFIDGEGCFNFTQCRNVLMPRILITNTNLEVLEEIKSKYGGDISRTEVKNKPHWKPRYSWRLGNSKSIKLAEDLYPYLIIKKKQAELFIDFKNKSPGRGGTWSEEVKQYFIDTMKFLNQKGR